MISIEKFANKYSNIFKENSQLLQERKLYPPAVIKYANSNKNLVLVAVEDKTAIGFIIGFHGENKSNILTIFVKKDLRNKKIGSLLVSTLIQQKKTLWTVRLRTIDYPIIGFFEKCDFQKITELNLYQKLGTEFIINSAYIDHLDNFVISVADHKHIPQLMKIEKDCFEPFWYRSKNEWKTIIDDQNAVIFVLQGEIENGQNKIVGFSHNSVNLSNGSREGQYIRIAVCSAFRRTGIATKLTQKAFEYFERNHVKKVYLSTVKENEQLNTMYQKWGFELFDSDTILGRDMS